jgi:hypothetical protein
MSELSSGQSECALPDYAITLDQRQTLKSAAGMFSMGQHDTRNSGGNFLNGHETISLK